MPEVCGLSCVAIRQPRNAYLTVDPLPSRQAPRAATLTPAAGVVPVAIVGRLAGAAAGGGFAGSKPVCWMAHE
jgi:hypothetical protein